MCNLGSDVVKAAADILTGGATTAGIGAAAGAAGSASPSVAAGTGGMADGSCSAERGCSTDTETMQRILQNLTVPGNHRNALTHKGITCHY